MIAALEFLNEINDRLGWPQIKTLDKSILTPEERKLVRLLNRVIDSVSGYNDWPLLRRDSSIILLDSITTDSDLSEFVTATKGSPIVTVAGQSFDQTFIGRAFQVSGDEVVYRIKTVTSPTQIDLDDDWINASITVADKLTAVIAMDQYTLPDNFNRPVDDWENFFLPHGVEPRTPNQFRKRRRENLNMVIGEPNIYTIYGLRNNLQVVHFQPFPETARILSFAYQKKHPTITSDQDQLLFPNEYYGALMDVVLEFANRDYEDSPKMEAILRDSLRQHNLQQSNPGATASSPIITPRNDVRTSIQIAYGIPSGSIDWGDAFDTGRKNGL